MNLEEILVKIGLDHSALGTGLRKVNSSLEEAGVTGEKSFAHAGNKAREFHKLMEKMGETAPGLGLGLKAMMDPMLGLIAAVGAGIAYAIEQLKEYNKTVAESAKGMAELFKERVKLGFETRRAQRGADEEFETPEARKAMREAIGREGKERGVRNERLGREKAALTESEKNLAEGPSMWVGKAKQDAAVATWKREIDEHNKAILILEEQNKRGEEGLEATKKKLKEGEHQQDVTNKLFEEEASAKAEINIKRKEEEAKRKAKADEDLAKAIGGAQYSEKEKYKASVEDLAKYGYGDIGRTARQIMFLERDARIANFYGNTGWRDADAKAINPLKKALQDAGVLRIDPNVELLELAKGAGLKIQPPEMSK